ncbi:MAG: 2-succinyl-6-hydroxy-2,4-cyclohexadiene-1-carboxylate synthase [Chloroflexi bacterium]|nr:2-succinyl-6-hydroxy-2,4-cyclohexadiene-1-carboxylate synthase [Chloroflexota bacterium]
MVKLAVRDVQYNLEISGQGERPLLLLHGFTGSSQNWQPVLPVLGERFMVIAVDLLGHGRSSIPARPARYMIESAAADLINLLDQFDIEQVNLLGYSMGGRLALYLATQYPQRCQTLILESASPGLADKTARAERRQQDNALAERIEREGIETFVDYWESLPLWTSQAQLPAETRAALREQRLQNNPLGLMNSLRGMGTGAQLSVWTHLPRLTMPVLLVTGELDAKFAAINREMADLIPGSRLSVVPDAGHTVHLERPQRYAELVRGFLEFNTKG